MRKIVIFLLLICLLVISPIAYAQTNLIDAYTPKPAMVTDIDNPVVSLNGEWHFSAQSDQRFWKKPRISKLAWKSIEVPGEWIMQGFQVEPNTAAAYAKIFTVPKSWKGKQVLVRFDGVYSLTSVYCNGKIVGRHEGGFTPFEIDLSDVIKVGKANELILSVQSESTADTLASATQYAAHQLGGITRKVDLFTKPAIHLIKSHIQTDLDQDYQNAMTIMDLSIQNASKKLATDLTIEVELNPVGGDSKIKKTWTWKEIQKGAQSERVLSIPVEAPLLWNPEKPQLYELDIHLIQQGMKLETVRHLVGFREIEVSGNQVFVNGNPIKLRGVNRHEVHPTRGRSLTLTEWRTDAHLFKAANVNYIRTSHYPPAEEFVDLCDSIGMFVEMEAPVCWVGHGANAHWQKADPHDSKYLPIIHQQVLETVAHYRNHPSVIIWSMANESAWGPTWASALELVNQADPSRPASFHDQAYGGFNNYGSTAMPVANMHYPGPPGPEIARKFDRPLLFGEYAHLNTYNRQEIVADPGVRDAWGRGLEKMWENMYYSTGCLGGALWSGVDDVFHLPDGQAVGYGEWGPIDGWRRPKPEYWHVKKIYSPVKIITRQIPEAEPGKPMLIPLENRHQFTDMKEIRIQWKLPDEVGTASMSLAPRQSGLLKIWPKKVPLAGEKIELYFYSPQGMLIDQYVIQVGSQVKELLIEKNLKEPSLQVHERIVQVILGESQWIFDAATGKLRTVVTHGTEVLTDGPELMVLPLKTGPCNTEHSLHIEPLNNTCLNWSGKVTQTGKRDDMVYVEVSGQYDEADIQLEYQFLPTGQVVINYELTARVDVNPRQVGLVFIVPGAFDQLSWQRQGQWTSYPDGHLGRTEGYARPFDVKQGNALVFGQPPEWSWEQDGHTMGINDFRATRDNLLWATLTDSSGRGIKLHRQGNCAVRTWVNGQHISFLAASFSTAGGDLFFSSHLADERQVLTAGDTFKGRFVLELL